MKTRFSTRVRRAHRLPINLQAGVSLVELMVGLALSVVVTSAMVVLMGNSMGTANRIIHSSQLSDELRNVMSMATRDLRRANYSANSIFCYGHSACGLSGGVAEQAGDIVVSQFDDDSSCITFALDRNSDGNAANDAFGGFKRVENTNGVGLIEMWIGGAGTVPGCSPNAGQAGWIELTDPATVNITRFRIEDGDSYTREVFESEESSFFNRQRQIQIQAEGQLVLEDASGIDMVRRHIEDVIYVRNDFNLAWTGS